MSLAELLFGRPLRSEEQEAQRIGPLRGIPVMGLDALASAAYGPEAALTVLMPLGLGATRHIEPISALIIALLAIVSAAPALLPYTLDLCLTILVFLTLVNLRGVREAGLIFMVPTYAFFGCLALTIVLGAAKALLAHGHPAPVVRPPMPGRAVEAAGAWVLLRAFASGCTAMTGIEAVSNGTPLFAAPTVKTAQLTLTILLAALAFLLAGIAYLSHAYGVAATPPGAAGYESVLSQLIAAVAGHGAFYYVAIASVVIVLCLSANTSFADFPRLCRVLALDEYLPVEFAHPGRRLVFSVGIVALAICAGLLLVAFGGITDRLIPLFAVGAFLAFTMSQAGMVAHWRKRRGAHAARSLVVNAVGALATAATLLVIVVSKFTTGAWITVLAIPALLAFFRGLRRDEERIERETDVAGPLEVDRPAAPIIVVPIKRLDRVARKALRLAMSLSPDVQVVQIITGDPDVEELQARWHALVEQPARAGGLPSPTLVVIRSPYRELIGPIVKHVRALTRSSAGRYVAVVVPELVERRWYQFLTHGHRAALLKRLLLLRGGPRLIVIDTPWYLRDGAADRGVRDGTDTHGPEG